MKIRPIDKIVEVLLVIGGLNMGIKAAFDFNLLINFFGYRTPLYYISYGLIGVAAVIRIIECIRCKMTGK